MRQNRLDKLLGALHEGTADLFRNLERWPVTSLNWRATAENWSALDVAEHVVMTEQAILRVMVENLRHGGRQIRTTDRWKSALVLAIMLAPTRVKIPNAVRYLQPSGTQTDIPALREVWAEGHRDLRQFLDGLTLSEQGAGLFRHPVGGWTTAGGALAFLRAHLHHHGYQIRRIEKALAAQKIPGEQR